MKRWRKILSGVVILVVAGVVTGIVIIKSLDFNEYRGLIAEQVKSATGRDLTISRELNLALSLSPSLILISARAGLKPKRRCSKPAVSA